MTDKIELPCDTPNCDSAAAIITNGTLTIIARHHGKRHLKTITLDELQRLLTEQSDINPLTHVAKVCSTPAVET